MPPFPTNCKSWPLSWTPDKYILLPVRHFQLKVCQAPPTQHIQREIHYFSLKTDTWISCLSEWLHPSWSQDLRVILHPFFSFSSPPPNLIMTKVVHTFPKTIHHNLLGLQEPCYLYFSDPYWSLKYQSHSFSTISWLGLQHSPKVEKCGVLFLNNNTKAVVCFNVPAAR